MALRELFVTIGAKTADFEKSMTNVQNRMQTVGKSMQNVGMGMTKWVTGPMVAVGAALTGLAVKTAEYGDHLAKTSLKLGISTDALQEMEYWASQNGLASDALERAIGRLNQRIGRAADGNDKYADAFEALGVQITNANGQVRETEEVMEDTIRALRAIEEPSLRSARAAEIFGTRMARDLMPALDASAMSLDEATDRIDELGIRMGEDAIENSVKFTDAMDDLKRSFTALFREIGEQVIPIFVDTLIPLMQEELIPLIRSVTERVAKLLEWFGNLSPGMQKTILVVGGLVAALGPALIIIGKVVAAVSALAPAFTAIIGVAKVVGVAIGALVLGPAAPFILLAAAIAAGAAVAIRFRDEISDAINTAVDFVGGALESLASFFQDTFQSIYDNTVGVFQRMWDALRGIINRIIEGINNMIQGINAINIDIPDWVPGWGGKSLGFNVPTIPQLAEGGTIMRPGVVQVGERGPELLHLPLGAQVQPLAAGGYGGMSIYIQNAYMRDEHDIETLARKLDDRARARERRA